MQNREIHTGVFFFWVDDRAHRPFHPLLKSGDQLHAGLREAVSPHDIGGCPPDAFCVHMLLDRPHGDDRALLTQGRIRAQKCIVEGPAIGHLELGQVALAEHIVLIEELADVAVDVGGSVGRLIH